MKKGTYLIERTQYKVCIVLVSISVADPESGAFWPLDPGSGIRDG